MIDYNKSKFKSCLLVIVWIVDCEISRFIFEGIWLEHVIDLEGKSIN